MTRSETSVLALLPTHLTLAAIGDRLGIGRPTVKSHVQHIYEKLNATNRAEAVESAENTGLLPISRSDRLGPGSIKTNPRRQRRAPS
jgi:LuxR family maltose regulon positive regulatory protein